MHTAKLRRVGGSVMLVIPPAFLEQLHLSAGVNVGVGVENGRLVVEPQARCLTLAALRADCDTEAASPDDDAAWTGSPAVGREVA